MILIGEHHNSPLHRKHERDLIIQQEPKYILLECLQDFSHDSSVDYLNRFLCRAERDILFKLANKSYYNLFKSIIDSDAQISGCDEPGLSDRINHLNNLVFESLEPRLEWLSELKNLEKTKKDFLIDFLADYSDKESLVVFGAYYFKSVAEEYCSKVSDERWLKIIDSLKPVDIRSKRAVNVLNSFKIKEPLIGYT